MQNEGYKIREQYGVYFITFTSVQWVDVFSKYCYVETVLESLKFCISQKKLNLHAWCLMTNHIHMIISAQKGNLSDIIRDFKKFTSGTILKQIETNAEESRRGWMLWIFKKAGANNSKNSQYQFWQPA